MNASCATENFILEHFHCSWPFWRQELYDTGKECPDALEHCDSYEEFLFFQGDVLGRSLDESIWWSSSASMKSHTADRNDRPDAVTPRA